MASRLNFHQTKNKLNTRLLSAQKLSYTYINFNISNNIKINKRVQSNLKAKNINKPIQNNRFNHQMNIFYLPYISSNNNFINNLQRITPKKNKKTMDVNRYSSYNKNRNKKKNDIKKSFILSSKKYNNTRYKDLEKVKKNLDIKDFTKKEDANGIKKEEKKENKLKKNKIYKNMYMENNRNDRLKHIFLKTNNKSIIIEEEKVIKKDKNEIKENIKNEEKEIIIAKKENIKEIKKEFYEMNIKKNTGEIINEKENNDEDKKSIKNEIEKEKEEKIMIIKKEEEIIKSENIEKKETSENIKKINEINLDSSYNMGKRFVNDLKTISKNDIFIKNQKKVYQEIPFKQELKTYSPICDKCFRLVYISFDYICDCISSYCLYCKNLSVYKYDAFIEKLNENKNPLLNCYCNKCFKSFIFQILVILFI